MLRSRRRGLLVAASIALLSFALAWAHGGPAADHMAMGNDHGGAPGIASMCLAVIQVVGAATTGFLAALLLSIRRRRASWGLLTPATSRLVIRPPARVRARAGPELLQVCLR